MGHLLAENQPVTFVGAPPLAPDVQAASVRRMTSSPHSNGDSHSTFPRIEWMKFLSGVLPPVRFSAFSLFCARSTIVSLPSRTKKAMLSHQMVISSCQPMPSPIIAMLPIAPPLNIIDKLELISTSVPL